MKIPISVSYLTYTSIFTHRAEEVLEFFFDFPYQAVIFYKAISRYLKDKIIVFDLSWSIDNRLSNYSRLLKIINSSSLETLYERHGKELGEFNFFDKCSISIRIKYPTAKINCEEKIPSIISQLPENYFKGSDFAIRHYQTCDDREKLILDDIIKHLGLGKL